jgi:hypothetical protein
LPHAAGKPVRPSDLHGVYSRWGLRNGDRRRCTLRLPARRSRGRRISGSLLCAGLIGWRSLVIAGDGKKLGLYGFGAAAHIVAQVARWQGRSVFGFTRPGDVATQAFARSLGAVWAGGSDEMPPEQLDAAIIFATVGDLVPLALKALRKGGRVVSAGIHLSDIPSFPYPLLWEERQLLSVANLTRQDGIDFLGGAGNGYRDAHHNLSAQKGKRGSGGSARRPLRRRRRSRTIGSTFDQIIWHPDVANEAVFRDQELKAICSVGSRFAPLDRSRASVARSLPYFRSYRPLFGAAPR